MSSQNAVRAFFHEHFVAGMCFRNPPRRIPGRGYLLLDPELKVLLTCPAFTETDSSQRRDRENDRRNAEVIWSQMVSLQEVCGHDLTFIARHRSQWWASTGGGISRRIHSRNRHTLQEFVDSHSPFLPFNPRNIQIQVVDFRHATRRMHDQVRLKRGSVPRSRCSDNQLSGAPFDLYRFGSEMNVNTKFTSSLNELINEIRVKKGKGTRATV